MTAESHTDGVRGSIGCHGAASVATGQHRLPRGLSSPRMRPTHRIGRAQRSKVPCGRPRGLVPVPGRFLTGSGGVRWSADNVARLRGRSSAGRAPDWQSGGSRVRVPSPPLEDAGQGRCSETGTGPLVFCGWTSDGRTTCAHKVVHSDGWYSALASDGVETGRQRTEREWVTDRAILKVAVVGRIHGAGPPGRSIPSRLDP
jgi:hypothetical protein